MVFKRNIVFKFILIGVNSKTVLQLVLKDVDQCSNMRQNLNHKLITMSQRFFGHPAQTNASRRAGNDNSSCRKSGALRKKTD